jgi:hypothetical protein
MTLHLGRIQSAVIQDRAVPGESQRLAGPQPAGYRDRSRRIDTCGGAAS